MPTFAPGVKWEDFPSLKTKLTSANLKAMEAAIVAYAEQLVAELAETLGTAASMDAGAAGETGKLLAADDPTTDDARIPLAHASTHASTGSDPIFNVLLSLAESDTPDPPNAGKANIYMEKDPETGLTQIVARFPNGDPIVLATQPEEAPVEIEFFPSAIHEETAGATAWVNPKNIFDADSDVASVSGAGSGKIAVLRLEAFDISEGIPEGAELLKVEAIYKARVKGTVEGNPIVGIGIKSGATFVSEAFSSGNGEYIEKEGGAVPTTLTEIAIDLTSHDWVMKELEDGAPLYMDVRCRNNGGKTSEFEWQYAGWRITCVAPVPGTSLLTHEDDQTNEDVTVEWGEPISAVSTARYQLHSTGGDPRPKGDGSASNGRWRRILLNEGDHVGGEEPERNEVGHNERRDGIEGGGGTFMLYPQGVRRLTWFSLRLDPSFPISNANWQLIMQMKQAQPYLDDGHTSPIVAMQARQNQFQIITPDHNEGAPLFTCPATLNHWVRFCWDVFYSATPGEGHIRLLVDDRPEATDWVPQHDSGILVPGQTLTAAKGAQDGVTSTWHLDDKEPIPSHLRLGIYRNPIIEGSTYVDQSNIQVYTPVV